MSDALAQTDGAAGTELAAAPAAYPNLTKAGRGRLPGVPNKRTGAVKHSILSVYLDLQTSEGEERAHAHFLKWATANPTLFDRLYVKLLPREMSAEVYNHTVGEVIFRGVNG